MLVLISVVTFALVGGPRLVGPRSAEARAGADTKPLLPDFDIVTPQGLLTQRALVKGKVHFRLAFISAVSNLGTGPAMVTGAHDVLSGPVEMTATQVISMSDGSTREAPHAGSLRYNIDPTHAHWHLLSFMTYELRRGSDYKLVRPDAKTGFCLGDRYRSPSKPKGAAPAKAVYKGDCGGHEPEAVSVEEGISVGYGDVYSAWRDGQYIDVTGLPKGTYYLVHRVNANHRLMESNYANNVSSLKVELTWPNGTGRLPKVAILAACTDKAKCASGYFFDKIP
jgi:hypothetical protein